MLLGDVQQERGGGLCGRCGQAGNPDPSHLRYRKPCALSSLDDNKGPRERDLF